MDNNRVIFPNWLLGQIGKFLPNIDAIDALTIARHVQTLIEEKMSKNKAICLLVEKINSKESSPKEILELETIIKMLLDLELENYMPRL